MSNLTLRVITAVTLIAALLALLFLANGPVFALVVFAFGLLAVWELWRLVQVGKPWVLLTMTLVYAACMLQLWFTHWSSVLWLAGGVHFGVTVYVLRFKPKLLNLGVGLYGAVFLACVFYAMTVLQGLGVWVLMTAMMTVWAADVGGYFLGKGFGGVFVSRGLAPHISPKKSWEGAIGGVVLATVLMMVCAALSSASSELQVWILPGAEIGNGDPRKGFLGFWGLSIVLPALFIAAYSVTGDLLESVLKRQAGVKDSSQLLPGHGGVLDRIDALIPVLPLCAAWAEWIGYR